MKGERGSQFLGGARGGESGGAGAGMALESERIPKKAVLCWLSNRSWLDCHCAVASDASIGGSPVPDENGCTSCRTCLILWAGLNSWMVAHLVLAVGQT
jgi:hypothetical protein